MKKTTLPLLLIFACLQTLSAQPQPCGPNPEMTSFCNEACIICDIDGFTGINDDPQTGQAPPGFCTTQVHHMQWIGFIAGSTNLTLSVSVFNCQNGEGLEIGIYRGVNCQNFQLVSNCDTDVGNNETAIFTNTVPLVVGQYYYFVMDGSADDVCNYTVEVLSGTTAVGVLEDPGTLLGDDVVCRNTPTEYRLSPPVGATLYSWTVDGIALSEQDTVLERIWPVAGTYNLCVTASNVCDAGTPVCRTVTVYDIPPVHIDTIVCENECWTGANTTICTSGEYEFHLPGSYGCDSAIFLNLTVLPASTTNLSLLICDGDSLLVGGMPFYETGQYEVGILTVNGCDSTINLDLQVIECEILGDLAIDSVRCTGEASGQLRFRVYNGTPPFQYSWERIVPGAPSGTGSISALNTETTIPNLPVGTYFITITDNFGNDAVLFGDLGEPLPLDAALSAVVYHGENVSCFGSADGQIEVFPSGGTPPYTFAWPTGAQTAVAGNLSAGPYAVTVTDSRGCSLARSITLTEPIEIVLDASFTDPGCGGLNTGAAGVVNTAGGTPPYTYALDDGPFGDSLTFAGLSPGIHVMTAQDANGCIDTVMRLLATPLLPEIDLGPTLSVLLAESVHLNLVQTTPLEAYLWTPGTGLSCTDCPEPEATPYVTTTYTLQVVAPGGCGTIDSVRVRVIAQRDVYVPNSFSPNSDGINDHFTIFAGPEVTEVRSLTIWSRWGEQVFQAGNFPANYESAGWDGSFRKKPAMEGVYLWVAELAFLDGEVREYTGDVVVVR